MSYWLTDPELFLYTKGTDSDDVHLWRCKKPTSSSSSQVVPMKPDDFEYVETVTDYLELIGDLFDWDETDYKRLIKYISERRLLVNSQGFVIAELYKVDKYGNKLTDGTANEEVPIYIRSLDVLPLKPYIPKLRERPIPSRTVKVLEDVNGKAALMEGDSQVTKLTARVENLEAENTRLESKNNSLDTSVTQLTAENMSLDSNIKTLESKVTKLTVGQVAMTDTIDDLESKNKTLEGKVIKLTGDLVTQMNALTTLQQELKNINHNTKEVWMNDLTNNEWVGIEGLQSAGSVFVTIVSQMGTFTVDESSTNVRARYWCRIKNSNSIEFSAVSLEDLTPNKERARFSQLKWSSFQLNGKAYACRIARL